MEEIKFEYVNEEERACRQGEGEKVVWKKRWVTELEGCQRTHSLRNTGKLHRKGKELMICNFKN